MTNIEVFFDDLDMEVLEKVKQRKATLFKEFNYYDENEVVLPGAITVVPQRVVHDGRVLDKMYLLVKIMIFGYEDMVQSRYLGVTEYVIAPESLEQLLLGSHMLVNQINGDRVLIEVSK